MTAPGAGKADGRTARRDRNRDAVLDAALELFREDVVPGLAEVAARSGVSTRSVQRYFADLDELVRAAMARHLEQVQPLFLVADLGVGPRDERVERMVSARLRLHDAVAPMVRIALLRAPANPVIGERFATARQELLIQVGAMFAPELEALDAEARREVHAGLDVLVGFESLEHLRQVRGLSEVEAQRVLVRAIGALLAAA